MPRNKSILISAQNVTPRTLIYVGEKSLAEVFSVADTEDRYGNPMVEIVVSSHAGKRTLTLIPGMSVCCKRVD